MKSFFTLDYLLTLMVATSKQILYLNTYFWDTVLTKIYYLTDKINFFSSEQENNQIFDLDVTLILFESNPNSNAAYNDVRAYSVTLARGCITKIPGLKQCVIYF